MKKLLIMFLLLTGMLVLAGCRDKNGEQDDLPLNGDDPGDWKIQYDMVETSPYFLDNVQACYQIFPIAFADSSGNGYGDLRGIIENVDYLADTLGIDCIWLNPINPSTTYHKYDVTDYYGIDVQFGSMADFEELIDVLSANGIRLLLDLVINHTSDAHPWFINARLGENRTYRDWYVWNTLEDRTAFPSTQGWHHYGDSYYFGYFWDRMPELNFDNPLVRTEIKNIAEFWLDKGVGGFRIDAARHIYDINEYPRGTNIIRENANWFREFNHFVKSVNPDAVVLGEVWAASTIVRNFYEGMDSAFNFDLSETIIEALKMGTHQNLAATLEQNRNLYRAVRHDFIDSVFLTNHDQNRIMSEMGYDMTKAALAARILFTLPGISWIYYGEELGMSGVKPDPAIRQPFKWSADSAYNTQGLPNATSTFAGIQQWNTYNDNLAGVDLQLLDEASLLNLYIELIALKQGDPVLAYGDFSTISHSDNRLLVFTRSHNGVHYLVIHNMSAMTRSVAHNVASFNLVYESSSFTGDATTFTLLPHQSVILEIDDLSVIFSPVT